MNPDRAKIKNSFLHVLIWAGYSLLTLVGPISYMPHGYVALFVLKTLVVNATVFYVNTFWLMPSYLFGSRKGRYAVAVSLTIAFFAVVNIVFDACVGHPLDAPEAPANDGAGWFPFHMVETITSSMGMLFVSTIFGYFSQDRLVRQREVSLTHQNLEFEMKFLKSQINPHFLFNALNNIYALSVIKSEKTPEMILKLSEMLRFTLYDSESKKVKLRREVDYIVNFIDFQKLKLDSEPNIRVDVSGCNGEMMIEPMLMIPFVENSFKHGNIDNAKKGWLIIEIKTLGPILVFQVRNSLPAVAINKDVVGGIGVENVRKRLEMLYPGRSELKIETTNNEFSVFMKIDTFAS